MPCADTVRVVQPLPGAGLPAASGASDQPSPPGVLDLGLPSKPCNSTAVPIVAHQAVRTPAVPAAAGPQPSVACTVRGSSASPTGMSGRRRRLRAPQQHAAACASAERHAPPAGHACRGPPQMAAGGGCLMALGACAGAGTRALDQLCGGCADGSGLGIPASTPLRSSGGLPASRLPLPGMSNGNASSLVAPPAASPAQPGQATAARLHPQQPLYVGLLPGAGPALDMSACKPGAAGAGEGPAGAAQLVPDLPWAVPARPGIADQAGQRRCPPGPPGPVRPRSDWVQRATVPDSPSWEPTAGPTALPSPCTGDGALQGPGSWARSAADGRVCCSARPPSKYRIYMRSDLPASCAHEQRRGGMQQLRAAFCDPGSADCVVQLGSMVMLYSRAGGRPWAVDAGPWRGRACRDWCSRAHRSQALAPAGLASWRVGLQSPPTCASRRVARRVSCPAPAPARSWPATARPARPRPCRSLAGHLEQREAGGYPAQGQPGPELCRPDAAPAGEARRCAGPGAVHATCMNPAGQPRAPRRVAVVPHPEMCCRTPGWRSRPCRSCWTAWHQS